MRSLRGAISILAGWTKKLTGLPTVTVGSVTLNEEFMTTFRSDEGAAVTGLDELVERLERGEFDLVALGRALIVNPDWPKQVRGRKDWGVASVPSGRAGYAGMKRILIAIFALMPAWAAETPVVLYPGLGAWHHAIATRNAEAQKFFDQGLSLLYGFNRYEALRSFRKAAELDAQAAMAYWGIAMALGPHVNMDGDGDVDLKAGCEALETGLRLTGVAAGERAYLEAAATRCPAYDPAKYIAAMKALAASFSG